MDTVLLCLVPVERDSDHLALMVLVRDSFTILMEWQWMARGIFSWLIVGNHRIQKFTAQGEFLTAVGTEGSGPLQFSILLALHSMLVMVGCMWWRMGITVFKS